ncbi:hypothetical protein Mgra_00006082 [Meloidogyne graminicola]|uniref:Uncharacterized protein n=1 Tax=Meloidogyne graminicola TaxID=189291 RepID=A0A8S9ZMG9_9BILA|nr:hypothetical protein Mgra_00006082 [Meloidogyne graminicola]
MTSSSLIYKLSGKIFKKVKVS